jgi:hypothetical protein
MLRLAIAGILGAIVMFIWSAIAHTVLPLGRIGITELPNDSAVVALQASVGQKAGLYFFPSMQGPEGKLTEAGYAKKLETSAQGLIAYQPPGGSMMTAGQLIGEFLLELVEATLLTFLLRFNTMHTVPGRISFAAAAGAIAAITTNGSYWNWYRFPIDYTLAYAFIQWVGFVLAGAMISVVLNWARRTPAS